MDVSGGHRSFFDSRASQWDKKTTSRQLEQLSGIFRRDLPDLKGPLLDIGSGTGILIPFLDNHPAKPFPLIELDLSREMLQTARNKFNFKPQIPFIQADARALPFSDECFRTIICFSVFPHFQDKHRTLGEIYRCLAYGGFFIILHLMGHEELNAVHQRAGEAVNSDVMPPAKSLAAEMQTLGFSIQTVKERSDLFLVISRK